MAQFYNLTSYQSSGEPWSNQFGTFQTFWAEFEGIEGGVMLSKKQGSTPTMGAVYGDLIAATSKSGNRYWKFKSQQKPQGVQAPAFSQQPATPPPTQGAIGDQPPGWFMPYGNMIAHIYKYVKSLEEEEGSDVKPEPTTPQPSNMPADFLQPDKVAGDPLDPVTQESLNEMFGDESR